MARRSKRRYRGSSDADIIAGLFALALLPFAIHVSNKIDKKKAEERRKNAAYKAALYKQKLSGKCTANQEHFESMGFTAHDFDQLSHQDKCKLYIKDIYLLLKLICEEAREKLGAEIEEGFEKKYVTEFVEVFLAVMVAEVDTTNHNKRLLFDYAKKFCDMKWTINLSGKVIFQDEEPRVLEGLQDAFSDYVRLVVELAWKIQDDDTPELIKDIIEIPRDFVYWGIGIVFEWSKVFPNIEIEQKILCILLDEAKEVLDEIMDEAQE